MTTRSTVFLLGFLLTHAGFVAAQEGIGQRDDTTKLLSEVVVRAYRYDRPMNEVPAAIAVVGLKDLERFNNTSILSAVNTIPGVRMEERSPGSYRFSIRGSLLRSPFGVRNVKVYWNGLPMTDGGGNTYLNLLDFGAITNSEIIKGPGASLYGAGTGGVILLNNTINQQPQIRFSTVIGSFGLQRYQLSAQAGTEKVKASVQYAHQQADGYRNQTKMRRDAINADVQMALNPRSTLSTTIFYTDLFYETPGGLTKAQYDEDPRQARPPKTTPPPQAGAEEAKAAVRNKSAYAGVMYEYAWSNNWTTRAGVYGSITEFENPSIRNYEIRDETNIGGRTDTQYDFKRETWKGKITFGAEYQYFFSPVKVYDNNLGEVGTNIQANDELASQQLLVFAQAELDLPNDFYLTIGASENFLNYDFSALLENPSIAQQRKFSPVFSPRIALLKKLSSAVSLYGSFSKGFSPPSLAEVRPSTGTYNDNLNPERGNSYELGLRGSALREKLLFELTVYDFQLDETIVIQRAPDGADYFVNAGKTDQRGVEAKLSWAPKLNGRIISRLNLWSSYTYNYYRFVDYVQDGNDFSGNRLTGVAPTIALLGADIIFRKIYINITSGYTDAIPLNDANSEYASSYVLLGARLGIRTNLTKNLPFEAFVGIDNALNERYSLGNDLNAFGGRYYNAAAKRNYYVGIVISPFLNKNGVRK
ncbi:MAG: TonB-dependent receptor [Cyclobacteriaceae bacterium]|nr:TonB-dependent receptor [Cyclobacteriaceae bacterium]